MEKKHDKTCHIEFDIIETDWQNAGKTECKDRYLRLWLVCGNARYPLGYVISMLSGCDVIHYDNTVLYETICKDGKIIKYYEDDGE